MSFQFLSLENGSTGSARDSLEQKKAKMEVISTFLKNFEDIRIHHPIDDQFMEKGRFGMVRKLLYFINNGLPITMVLPAFPVKSPNNVDKVLGKLPDRAEEIALERLETFCCEIEKYYPIGVNMVLFTDGLVFNDLFGETPEEIATYKQALQEMVRAAGYTHIEFDGLENYIRSPNIIQEMMRGFDHVDIREQIKENEDLCHTYNGFKKFLHRDLALNWIGKSKKYAEKQCAVKAKLMMQRNVAFSSIVDREYPHAIRLSIHAYNNAGPKYGIHLLPEESAGDNLLPGTPWHRVICEDMDGTVHSMELRDVDRSEYVLVWKYGRRWGFVERAPKGG